jgi:HSP20 family molecular chaperone IbpA
MNAQSLFHWFKNSQPNLSPGRRHAACAVAVIAASALTVSVATVFSASSKPSTPPAASTAVMNTALSLNEDANAYTVTLALPNGSAPQINVRMEGDTLHIASGGTPGGARFEQNLLLPQADVSANPDIKREGNQLVVTVPKGDDGSAATAQNHNPAPVIQPSAPAPVIPPNFDAWNRNVSDQFARMQRQMNAMMNAAFQNFGTADPFADMIGGGSLGGGLPEGGTVRIQDKPDAYVVHARMPSDEMKNVHVSVDNDRLLKLSAEASSSSNGQGSQSMQRSEFTQMLTLPGPVRSKDMKIDQKNGELQITLPKDNGATAS